MPLLYGILNSSHKKIHQIEVVQRRAAKFVTRNYRSTTSVTDLLPQLNWITLQGRRRVSRFVEFHNAFRGQNSISFGHLAKPFCSNRQLNHGSVVQISTNSPFSNAPSATGIYCHLISSLCRCHPPPFGCNSPGPVNTATILRQGVLTYCRMSNRRTEGGVFCLLL